ncbi:hypothetical protein [Clostridium baratii]|uniref:hypothetical protein n=1 Tax=Clostridium baratii TaxID=1561 RepID=UPI0030D53A86
MQFKRRYKINFSSNELDKLNTIDSENKRKKAMSVYQYILKNANIEDGFLEVSLYKLHKKFKRDKKKNICLTYFKELAKLLVEIGLLAIKKVGRLIFYGRKILSKSKNSDNENKPKKDNKNDEVKEVEDGIKIDDVKEEKEEKKFTKASRETILETAYEILEEAGLKSGSRTYFQVIESLNYILNKKDIHIEGMKDYIEKTIEDKVTKQSKFKEKLRNIRNKGYTRFNDFPQRERSEEEWNNLEKGLLGWD